MRVVGYSWCADTYCVACSEEVWGDQLYDEQDPPVDREGNEVHPIFSDHEFDYRPACGLHGCNEELDVRVIEDEYP